jgi:N utilization substance protein A
MEVVVPDDQLSLAIGRKGQNVRLASRLTGWSLDVVNETNYNLALREGLKSLIGLEGVNEKLASFLYEEGFGSAADLSKATVADLMDIEGMTEDTAAQLIRQAGESVSAQHATNATPPEEPLSEEVKSDLEAGHGEEERT